MDDSEFLAEAERRDAELDANPALALGFEETIEKIRTNRTREQVATMQPGRNIAMKVPATEFEATVAFYEKTLGFCVVNREASSVRFDHGGGHFLWIDRVEGLAKAEVWLEVRTTDIAAAAEHLKAAHITRCDEVEPLPEGMKAFWIKNPVGVVHLVTEE